MKLSFVHLSTLGGAPEGYITMAFSDHQYLITLSHLPEFEIAIWDWRIGVKQTFQKSHEHSLNQQLRYI